MQRQPTGHQCLQILTALSVRSPEQPAARDETLGQLRVLFLRQLEEIAQPCTKWGFCRAAFPCRYITPCEVLTWQQHQDSSALGIKNCCFPGLVRIQKAPRVIKRGPVTQLYPLWLALVPFAASFLLPCLIPPGAHLQASEKGREMKVQKVNWIWNPPTFHPVPVTRKKELAPQNFVKATLSSFRERCPCQLQSIICFFFFT